MLVNTATFLSLLWQEVRLGSEISGCQVHKDSLNRPIRPDGRGVVRGPLQDFEKVSCMNFRCIAG